MCGIAGIVDLAGNRPPPAGAVAAMARAIFHRGPDDDGFLDAPSLCFANRRLSIVGLADGKQPIANEDHTVQTVYNGEFFDYVEKREELKQQGHVFRTSTDTELIPHLWEQHGMGMLDHLRGQFACAVYDAKTREVVLARDRIGIVPLFYSVRRDAGGEWFLFASEIKALLASGMVRAEPDFLGLNGIFTHFAMPGPRTCFSGITSLPPGNFLRFRLGEATGDTLQHKPYWSIDFPDQGQEVDGPEDEISARYEELLYAAVKRRLRADVPVVSYLSGGVDSSQVVAMAVKSLDRKLPTFTIGVQAEGLNEESEAGIVAKHVGCEQIVVPFGGADVMSLYPQLMRTAEMPVIDTASAALLALAAEVHRRGYKVALTGEGSDEMLGGYPWFKVSKAFGFFDVFPRLELGQHLRRLYSRLRGMPVWPMTEVRRNARAVGGMGGWLDVYGLMSMSRLLFYSEDMREAVGDHSPYEELGFNPERMARWHPFHRSLALGLRVMLPGMLLLCKGDRVAMHSSVETRYPFLDEEVIAYGASLHPRWKLRGFKDKYVLRTVANRWLPQSIAQRRKVMFRAPMDCFHLDEAPPFVDQLLSEESLRKTGYFDPAAVKHWRERVPGMRKGGFARTAVEMGLVAVTSTQLWHRQFIDDTLADVPETPAAWRSPTPSANGASRPAAAGVRTIEHGPTA